MLKKILFIVLLAFGSCSDELDDSLLNPYDPKSNNHIPSISDKFHFQVLAENKIEIEWEDISMGTYSFLIDRSENNNNIYSKIATVEPGKNTFIDEFQFQTNKNYYYRITPVGKNTSSNQLFGMAKIEFDGPIIKENVSISNDSLTFSWLNNSTYTDKFILERSINNGEFEKIAELNLEQNKFTEVNLDTFKVYSYRLTANSKYNVSNYSKVLKVKYGTKIDEISRKDRQTKWMGIRFLENQKAFITVNYSHSGYETPEGTIKKISYPDLNEISSVKLPFVRGSYYDESYYAISKTGKYIAHFYWFDYIVDIFNSNGENIFSYNEYKLSDQGGFWFNEELNYLYHLYTYQSKSILKIYDLNQQKLIDSIKINGSFREARFTEDENKVILISKNQLKIMNLPSFELSKTVNVELNIDNISPPYYNFCVNKDGSEFAVANISQGKTLLKMYNENSGGFISKEYDLKHEYAHNIKLNYNNTGDILFLDRYFNCIYTKDPLMDLRLSNNNSTILANHQCYFAPYDKYILYEDMVNYFYVLKIENFWNWKLD
ncbi:MAG: hypothetical protein GXX85_07635 [Ignavibacteria bacterium]|nr:hypothetical protein [Ignavibacteria bacterium]